MKRNFTLGYRDLLICGETNVKWIETKVVEWIDYHGGTLKKRNLNTNFLLQIKGFSWKTS